MAYEGMTLAQYAEAVKQEYLRRYGEEFPLDDEDTRDTFESFYEMGEEPEEALTWELMEWAANQ